MSRTFDHPRLHRLVRRTVNRYAAAKGLRPADADDALGTAFLAAVEAAASYDPARGVKESTWVGYKAHKAVLEEGRQTARRWKRLPTVPLQTGQLRDNHDEKTPSNEPGRRDPAPFDRDDLLTGLRRDAAFLVELVLDTPLDLWEPTRDGRPKPGTVRDRLVKVLEGLGWAASRTRKAMKEVAEVLYG